LPFVYSTRDGGPARRTRLGPRRPGRIGLGPRGPVPLALAVCVAGRVPRRP
jgi:hypothetical protein